LIKQSYNILDHQHQEAAAVLLVMQVMAVMEVVLQLEQVLQAVQVVLDQ
jgi:hypothetical protein